MTEQADRQPGTATWVGVILTVLGALLFAGYVNAFVVTGFNLGWTDSRSVLIYAGIPVTEGVAIGLIAARALRDRRRRRLRHVLLALWPANGLNLFLSLLGVFGFY